MVKICDKHMKYIKFKTAWAEQKKSRVETKLGHKHGKNCIIVIKMTFQIREKNELQ